MSWLLALLGIMALIVLHELGHFLVAKAVGMRVERFSLFFPPKLLGIRWGETEYMIGAIPFGGYVKITGMNPEEVATLEPELASRAYYNQAPWRRIVVILAGPGMNLLIAFLLFWVVLFSGNLAGSNTLSNLNPSIQTLVPSTSVAAILDHQPADGVLKPGDRIIAVDGHPATVSSTMAAIADDRCAGAPVQGCRAAAPVILTVRRGGKDVTVSVYPRFDKAVGRMLVGFDFGVRARAFGAFGAASTSLREMWGTTTSLLTNLGRAFTSSAVRHHVSSIVGITEFTQEAVRAGAGYALIVLGFVSLALAVMNLFPFLPLDGGHVVWALAEKVRRRRVSLATMWRFSSVGLVLLAFLVINGFSNDISRLAG